MGRRLSKHVVSASAKETGILKSLPEKKFPRIKVVECPGLMTPELSPEEMLRWEAMSAKEMW